MENKVKINNQTFEITDTLIFDFTPSAMGSKIDAVYLLRHNLLKYSKKYLRSIYVSTQFFNLLKYYRELFGLVLIHNRPMLTWCTGFELSPNVFVLTEFESCEAYIKLSENTVMRFECKLDYIYYCLED